MAETPVPQLEFTGDCPDCGRRTVVLPPSLPPVGDDFDWNTRDYESLRRFMLEELQARLPGRTRWTPADLEIVIIEIFATVLDRLSDRLDRVSAEAYLETARQPDSLRQLLHLIGYEVESAALQDPQKREAARREGPLSIHEQKRMVTVADYARLLEDHPLVAQAHSWMSWGGSWPVIRIAVIPSDNCHRLADAVDQDWADFVRISAALIQFHQKHGLANPWPANPTLRSILQDYLEAYRMAGQEVQLVDYRPVGIQMSIAVRIRENYFQSEIRYAVAQTLGRGPGGFFRSGRLQFGEDLYLGDLVQTLMDLEGVAEVCIDPFKKVGKQFPNQSVQGFIALNELEVAVCDQDPAKPERGFYRLKLYGGRRG